MKFALLLFLFADSEGFVNLTPAGPGAIVTTDERGGDLPPSSSAPSPAAFDIDPELFGRLVESQSVAAPEPLRMIVYSRRTGCPPCDRLHAEVGDGDEQVAVEYRYEEQYPPWMRRMPTPLIHCPSLDTYIEGYHNLAQIKQRFRVAPQVVAAPAPIPGGTFDASLIEKYLPLVVAASLEAKLPREEFDVGNGMLLHLNGGGVKASMSGGPATATFTAPLPTVKYGFLKIECSGVVYNKGMLDVQLKSFPDIRRPLQVVQFKAR